MPASDTIKNLVQRFEEHLASYRSGKYNETQLRVSLIERMLELHKHSPRLPHRKNVGKESMQREIESTDRRIDKLVYELYGLSDEEIKIVES